MRKLNLYINKNLILIPLFYTCYTRLKTRFNKITYIFSYIIPVLLISFLHSDIKTYQLFFKTLISILAYMSIYEIGYIINDIITIKKEKKPTIRLDKIEIEIIRNNIFKIIVAKLVISYILIYFINFTLKNIEYFEVVLITLMIYYLHNNIRNNKINFFTFMTLSFLRFVSPIYILNINLTFEENIAVFLLFVFIRNLEQVGKKYKILKLNLNEKKEELRVIYYIILLLIYYNFKLNLKEINILYYMIVFRLLGYFFYLFREKIKKRRVL